MIRRRRRRVVEKRRFYRINQNIIANKIRVIDETGKQIGVMDKEEALFRARQNAKDLIEISPNAKPPVCKIIDFNKFKYQEDKKQASNRKNPKGSEIKEVRFTPFIAENDFQIRIKKAKGFLKEGYKIKLTVRFKGRQMAHKQFGFDILKKAVETLKNVAIAEQQPKMQGFLLMTVLKPEKQKEVAKPEKNAQTKNS